ncbi:MAG TPA: hypothetical protein VGC09_10000 [Rhodopila sp.]
MEIYIFSSSRAPDVLGFTADGTGANLPAEFAPWSRQADAGEAGAGIGSSEPVKAAIDRDGFYVATSETISRSTGIPWVS